LVTIAEQAADRSPSLTEAHAAIHGRPVREIREAFLPKAPACPEINMDLIEAKAHEESCAAIESLEDDHRQKIIELLNLFPRFQGIIWGNLHFDNLLDNLRLCIERTAWAIKEQDGHIGENRTPKRVPSSSIPSIESISSIPLVPKLHCPRGSRSLIATVATILAGLLLQIAYQWGRNVGYRQAQARYYISPIIFRPEDKRP